MIRAANKALKVFGLFQTSPSPWAHSPDVGSVLFGPASESDSVRNLDLFLGAELGHVAMARPAVSCAPSHAKTAGVVQRSMLPVSASFTLGESAIVRIGQDAAKLFPSLLIRMVSFGDTSWSK